MTFIAIARLLTGGLTMLYCSRLLASQHPNLTQAAVARLSTGLIFGLLFATQTFSMGAGMVLVVVAVWQAVVDYQRNRYFLTCAALVVAAVATAFSFFATPPAIGDWTLGGIAALVVITITVLYPRYKAAEVNRVTFHR